MFIPISSPLKCSFCGNDCPTSTILPSRPDPQDASQLQVICPDCCNAAVFWAAEQARQAKLPRGGFF